MADENKDRTPSISSGTAAGPGETLAGASGTTGTTGMKGTTGTTGTTATTSTAGTARSSTAGMASAQGMDRSSESGGTMASSARKYADDVASRAKDKSRSMFEEQKESALGQVGSVAQAIRSSAGNLKGEGQDQTARYVQMIADQLESLGNRVRDKDLDTLVQDAQNLARRAPGTFLIGSVAVGFLLARFLKSSNERQYGQYGTADDNRRVLAAGEAGPYVGGARSTGTTATTGTTGTTGTTRTVGADGTPSTATGSAASGLGGSNIGGNPL